MGQAQACTAPQLWRLHVTEIANSGIKSNLSLYDHNAQKKKKKKKKKKNKRLPLKKTITSQTKKN
eukprot:NODE_29687_length_439_cov_0.967949.p4 GENE.NODE_29687_length_439_cov_0.967949~~NODE_29687_length_439_cov_0.967949.p4  ORF type:complete len:65 (+),score=24.83 NODE_29687_length_439_cov_0.967949:203-397(+)